jgi:hypothetical protein
MTSPETSTATANPVRYGSRYVCALCQAPVPSARARYCTDACRQRAYRLRQAGLDRAADEPALVTPPRRQGKLAVQRVYECSACGQRFLGERRCPDCNRFCRGLGLGGPCPSCDEPVAVADLIVNDGS